MDKEAFHNACDKIIGKERARSQIGTLGEKTLHAVVKSYIEEDQKYQEVKIEGFYADICRPLSKEKVNGDLAGGDWEIIEVQTKNFSALRKKLPIFLNLYPVDVVYPMPYEKWLKWIDTETGEISKRRKSPKRWNPWEISRELYRIKDFLIHPNLTIRILRINMEESRYLNGWSSDRKKGSSCCDRMPLELVDEIVLSRKEDYAVFFPEEMRVRNERENNYVFTVKEYQKFTHLSGKAVSAAISIMKEMNVIRMLGKRGRAYLYKMEIHNGDL